MNEETVHGEHMSVYHDDDLPAFKVKVDYDKGMMVYDPYKYTKWYLFITRIKGCIWRLLGKRNWIPYIKNWKHF